MVDEKNMAMQFMQKEYTINDLTKEPYLKYFSDCKVQLERSAVEWRKPAEMLATAKKRYDVYMKEMWNQRNPINQEVLALLRAMEDILLLKTFDNSVLLDTVESLYFYLQEKKEKELKKVEFAEAEELPLVDVKKRVHIKYKPIFTEALHQVPEEKEVETIEEGEDDDEGGEDEPI